MGSVSDTAALAQQGPRSHLAGEPARSFAPAAPAAAAPAPSPVAADGARGRHGQAQRQNGAAAAPAPTIALQAWVPDAPYMKRLQDAGKDELYRVYLDERAACLSSSSFYMDAAGVFFERGLPELGLRVLPTWPR